MTSKAKRRRLKKARQTGEQHNRPPTPRKEAQRPPQSRYEAPTPEQAQRAGWLKPERGKPWVRLDMIGLLHQRGEISDAEEQAARVFQELRGDYLAELQTRGFGSCLADNMAGHNSDDGRAEVIRAYRQIEKAAGFTAVAHLSGEVFKTSDERPHLIGLTRFALKAIAEM